MSPDFAYLDVAEDAFLKALGANKAALDLINRAGNFNDVSQVSALQVMRALAAYKFGTSTKTIRLEGGNDTLCHSLGAALNDVRPQHQVSHIESTRNGVEVTCQNGEQFLAENVVIAIPFSVLRTIKLRLRLPISQQNAIHRLPYTKITKMVCTVEKPFWEIDGLPAGMWTDSSIERCFITRDKSGSYQYTIFINGTGTAMFDALPDEQASKLILSELNRIRPSTKNALRPLIYHSWGNDPLSLGAYHAFAPGQVTEFAASINQPVVQQSGTLYIAGENGARVDAGMEGALESGENAAKQIISA
jgi:monoamine oxidase